LVFNISNTESQKLSITKTDLLMLFREIITLCWEWRRWAEDREDAGIFWDRQGPRRGFSTTDGWMNGWQC